MGLILERWLWLLSPLFAAAVGTKKTAARKKTRQGQAAPKTASRAARRPASKEKAPRAQGAKAGTKPGTAKAGAAKTGGAKAGARKPGARGKAAEQLKAAGAKGAAKAPSAPVPKPPAPIGRPLLLLPENGKYADSVQPRFRWLSVGGANRYEVVWSEEPNFAGGHPMISIATEAAVPPDRALHVGATYYWRVRGGNEGGWGPWSVPSSFQVLETPPTS